MDPTTDTTDEMSPERWQQIQRVMLDCLEAPDRSAYLAQVCAGDPELLVEVERLLGSHDRAADDWLEPEEPPSPPETAAMKVIGNYRLEQRLGSGGMGEVFEAVRHDEAYDQRVAVKLLRPGIHHPDVTSRFRTERQILANIRHPHIAQLLDGGEADSGQPYLVMELVNGRPIDDYCDQLEATIRERLELFCKVCDAVEAAHRNLVVHRDLKPSNILVTEEGEPKLLDFGIAKILQPETFPSRVAATETGLAPMTPRYAGPEQLMGGAITTATDVYSLGVLLYELLTGRRPYRFDRSSLDSMIQAICHDDPTRPSTILRRSEPGSGDNPPTEAVAPAMDGSPATTSHVEALSRRRGCSPRELQRQLSGDLDAIVLKALRKSPDDRYPSVAELSADIRRHLTNRPVRARRGSFGYGARKFVRRHRWGVAALVAFVAMLVTFISILWLERRETAAQRDRFEEVAALLVEVFEIPNPTRSRGRQITARELLISSVDKLQDRFTDQPDLRADIQGALAGSFAGLGLYREAGELFGSSVELYEELGFGDRPETARFRQQWADTLAGAGDYDRAAAQAKEALEARRRLFGEIHPEVVESLVGLAEVRRFQGEFHEAATLLREAAGHARLLGDPESLADVLDQLAVVEAKLGRHPQAESAAREAVALLRGVHGPDHPRSALMTANLAEVIRHHQPDEAEKLLRFTASVQRELFDRPHPDLALTLHHLGRLLSGKPDSADEAERLLTESIGMNRQIYGGGGHPSIAIALQSLAALRLRQDRLEEADALYREALTMLEKELGPNHVEVALCHNSYAGLLFARGQNEAAQQHIDTAWGTARHVLGDDHPEVAAILSNAASLATQAKELEKAVSLRQPAIDIVRKKLGATHPHLGIMLFNQSVATRKLGRFEESARLLEEAVPIREIELGSEHKLVHRMLIRLAMLHLDLQNWSRAESFARRGLESSEAHLPAEERWQRAARRVLGSSLYQLGRYGEAERELAIYVASVEDEELVDNPLLVTPFEQLAELYESRGKTELATELRRRLQAASRLSTTTE